MFIAMTLLLTTLYSYPVKKFLKYVFHKFGFKNKQLFLITYVSSLLVSAIMLLFFNGFTLDMLIWFVFYAIPFSYWYLLDYLSLNLNSKFIKFLNNKMFRFFFGVVVFCLVFAVTIGLFKKFDPYYISPLVITILYMIVVYRKGSSRLSAGEYRIRPNRRKFF